MNRAVLAALVAMIALGSARVLAYPLYSIGTESRGQQWNWQYSGFGSDGLPYSNAHATQATIKSAIGETFHAFTVGSVKDAAGQACSTLTFVDQTPAGGSKAGLNQMDGQNTEGVFVTSQQDPLYQYMQGGVVAFATPSPDNAGYVVDCDTAFNAVDFVFGTDNAHADTDLQRIAMQETAHCFGLDHVCQQSPGDGNPPCNGADVDLTSVMFPYAQAGTGGREPDGRDQDNMCQIYPVNGVGRPCDSYDTSTQKGYSTPDCAAGMTCQCTDVGQICTRTCSTDANCPGGASCLNGACVPNFYPGTAQKGVPTRVGRSCDTSGKYKPVGSACAADADCGPGERCSTAVPGGYCTLDCSNAVCPSGSACLNDVEKANDALCMHPCTFDTTTCGSPDCGAGQQCQPLANGTNGVCWAPCKADLDCDPSGQYHQKCDVASGSCYDGQATPLCGPNLGKTPPTCAPQCMGVTCGGGDGCGGTCADPATCKPKCAPTCSGATCGDPDGCGGTCTDSATCKPRSLVTPPRKGCGCGGGEAAAVPGLLTLALARRRSRRAT
jgi:hypothetical protein